jgi:hypothetical protein
MLQVVSEGYPNVTMCCNIHICLFDMGIQLALIWHVAIHAIYVTIVVRRPAAFRASCTIM